MHASHKPAGTPMGVLQRQEVILPETYVLETGAPCLLIAASASLLSHGRIYGDGKQQ